MQQPGPSKAPDAFRTISEVGEDLDIPQHVLRFWETRFTSIRPLKRGGGRRYYRPDDVELLRGIRTLLYGQGYTIKGVQRILKEQGARVVQEIGRGGGMPTLRPEPAQAADAYEPAEEAAGWQEPPAGAYAPVLEPVPAPLPSRAVVAPGLPSADVDRLRGVLADLIECQRVLAGLTHG